MAVYRQSVRFGVKVQTHSRYIVSGPTPRKTCPLPSNGCTIVVTPAWAERCLIRVAQQRAQHRTIENTVAIVMFVVACLLHPCLEKGSIRHNINLITSTVWGAAVLVSLIWGIYEYAVKMGSGGMTYIPSFRHSSNIKLIIPTVSEATMLVLPIWFMNYCGSPSWGIENPSLAFSTPQQTKSLK
jgi:hypothetical protein